MQIISLQNSEKELKIQIDYKIVIKHLEDLLKIEVFDHFILLRPFYFRMIVSYHQGGLPQT